MIRPGLLPGLCVLAVLGLGASGPTSLDIQQRMAGVQPGSTPLPRPLPRPLPDLTVHSLVLDAENSLTIVLANAGTADVPAGKGRLNLFVDGQPVLDVPLASLPNQEFRTAGLSSEFDTGVVLYGQDRRISVIVDARDEVEELDDIWNSRSVTLNSIDFGQSDLEPVLALDGGGFVSVEIRNNGRAASPGGVQAELRVELDGILVHSSQLDLDPIVGGGAVSFNLREVRVEQPTPISATLEFTSAHTDGDTTNNRDSSILPEPSLAHYDYLFADPIIKSHLVFEIPDVTYHGYDDWPQDLKDDLNASLIRLEQGQAGRVQSVPATYEYSYFTSEATREFYLAQVAHSFWIDANEIVPWKLQDLGDEIEDYLDFRQQFNSSSGNKYYFKNATINWNPHGLYHFLANRDLVRSTRLETVYALVRYLRRHLLHQIQSHPPEQKWGYPATWQPAERVLFPVPGQRHWVAGCTGTSGLIKTVLRSVNLHTETDSTTLSNGQHGTPYFPEEGLRIVHGDDLYNAQYRPWLGVIRTEDLFFSEVEYAALIDTGKVDCTPAGECNTQGEQNSKNYKRRFLLKAMQVLPGYFLDRFCDEGPAGLDETLTGNYALPFLTSPERAEFLARASLRMSDLGSGEVDAGCDYVDERKFLSTQLRTPVTTGLNPVPYFVDRVYTSERYEPPGEFMTFRMSALDPQGEQLRFRAEDLPGDAGFGGLGDIDLDGQVGSADVLLLQDFLDGAATLSLSARARADVNDDELLTEEDLALLDQAVSGQAPLNTGVFTWESPVVSDTAVKFIVSDGSYDYALQLRIYIQDGYS